MSTFEAGRQLPAETGSDLPEYLVREPQSRRDAQAMLDQANADLDASNSNPDVRTYQDARAAVPQLEMKAAELEAQIAKLQDKLSKVLERRELAIEVSAKLEPAFTEGRKRREWLLKRIQQLQNWLD